MKRILKLKKIKNTKTAKKYINKKRKAKRICKKLFLQIDSPHNTNEYLMSVNSSPFYNNEDEDEDSYIIPSPFIKLSNDTNSELDLFVNREAEATNEKTILMDDDQKEEKKKIIQRLLR